MGRRLGTTFGKTQQSDLDSHHKVCREKLNVCERQFYAMSNLKAKTQYHISELGSREYLSTAGSGTN